MRGGKYSYLNISERQWNLGTLNNFGLCYPTEQHYVITLYIIIFTNPSFLGKQYFWEYSFSKHWFDIDTVSLGSSTFYRKYFQQWRTNVHFAQKHATYLRMSCSKAGTGKFFFKNLTIYINGLFKTPYMLQFDVFNQMRRQQNRKEIIALRTILPLESRARHRSKINALEPSSDCSGLRHLTMDATLIS